MDLAVDRLWSHLHTTGISWLGFYARAGKDMVLLARRDKPACSPIGLHGVCGRACLERTSIVVTDVANLGDAYVACDPRDLSELVIPMFDRDGTCWGVFDADSFQRDSFTTHDAHELHSLFCAIGLTAGDAPDVLVV